MGRNTEKNGKDWRLGVCAIVFALALWQFIAAVIIRYPFILPAPTDVLSAFISLLEKGEILLDLEASLIHFAIGLGMALLFGIPLGIMMGWSRRIESFIDPLIELLRPIPPLAWIPFAIIWFGLTSFSGGFIIFVGAVFPVIINTYSGFRGVPRVFVEAGRMLGCTRSRDLVRYIAFPAALPSVAAGIRIATGVGWMCLVAAELFGVSNYGLGQKLWFFYSLHQMDSVVVYMIILGMIGLAFDMVFRYYVERYFLRWRTGEVA